MGRLPLGAVVLALVTGCAHAASTGPTSSLKLPESAARKPHPPPPASYFWTRVDVDIHAAPRKPLALPVAEKAIVRTDGAAALYDALAPDAKERLRKDGLVVIGSEAEPPAKSELSFGAFYRDIEDKHVRALVTADALFALTRLAIEGALARVEDDLAPAVDQLLTALDTRLAAESKGVGTTLAEAYKMARGVIATARVLSSTVPAAVKLPPEVLAEKTLVEAHAAAAVSTVLGVVIDYSRFVVPSDAARPGTFRALAYLGSVPFALAAHAESPGSSVDVAQARTSTRAALLIARLCDRDVDGNSYALYTRIARYLNFVWGPPDDLTLVDLDDIGTAATVDLTKPEHIIDVAKVDRIRAGALKRPAPVVFDGGFGRSARIFGGHASPDAIALTSLLGPATGHAQESAPPSIQRDGRRVIPSTLDIAAWIGAPGARAALHDTHADAFDGFEPMLAKVVADRPDEYGDAYHASVYGSLLAAVMGYAAPTEPEPAPLERLHLETTLSAWTMIRHVDQPFARTTRNLSGNPTGASSSNGAPYVEAAPETIARLLATVRQTKRGLAAISPATQTPSLDEGDELLSLALKAAEQESNDEPTGADLTKLVARLVALDDGPVVAIVSDDPPSHRLLAAATGRIEPLLMLVRDAGKEEPTLFVGAHVAHHEIVTDAGEAPTDATWLAKASAAARPAFVTTFRFLPAGRLSP